MSGFSTRDERRIERRHETRLLCGIGLIVFSIRRGDVTNRYGKWNRFLV
jgi:hypothetical protein